MSTGNSVGPGSLAIRHREWLEKKGRPSTGLAAGPGRRVRELSRFCDAGSSFNLSCAEGRCGSSPLGVNLVGRPLGVGD